MSKVPTMMPPIIANAMGAQKPSREIGISARLAAAAVNMIGRVRWIVASKTAVPSRHAFAPVLLDLHDQDHRISDQNADQRENSQNGDKTHRRIAGKHGGDHADETEWGHREDQEQALKTLQLDHQDRGHHEEHQRDDCRDRSLRFCAFFHRTSDFDAIAGRQRALKLVHASAQLLHDRGRLRWADGCLPAR